MLVLLEFSYQKTIEGGTFMKKIIWLSALSLLVFVFATGAYALKAIQIQTSSDGNIEASLIEVKEKRGVLTVKVVLKNISKEWIEPELRFAEAYYADVDDGKKYFPLKDSEGKFIAGHLSYDWGGGTFKEKIGPDQSKIIWIKFPAPPETTETIDIFIPKLLPFEEVIIMR
jgi:hypothetical protein